MHNMINQFPRFFSSISMTFDFWRVFAINKGVFFRKCDSFFKSPILPKKIFQKTILNLKYKISANNSIMSRVGVLNFKFRIVFWNIFFGDMKNELHFLKKSHL